MRYKNLSQGNQQKSTDHVINLLKIAPPAARNVDFLRATQMW